MQAKKKKHILYIENDVFTTGVSEICSYNVRSRLDTRVDWTTPVASELCHASKHEHVIHLTDLTSPNEKMKRRCDDTTS